MSVENTKITDINLVGSIRDLEETLHTVIKVANNHEARYEASWQEMSDEEFVMMIQDKVGRRYKTLKTPEDKLEEAIDGAVYNLFLVWKLQQQCQNFKYPTREDKTERDHNG